jgi:transposase InsO family protein
VQREFGPTVYVMASRHNGTLYTGVTSDFIRRIHEHREGLLPRFTREHGVERLVWFEQHATMEQLGFRLSQSSVSRYKIPRGGLPAQGWATFLRNHAGEIAGIDMLCTPTLTFRRLYAFVVLSHRRRAILHVEVTDHPTARWLALQVGEAFATNALETFLVRDNDGAYGLTFRRKLRAMGIRDRPTMPHSPWQNGHVERLIGSSAANASTT